MIYKKKIEIFNIIILIFISFFINYYFGHQGLMPLDDLQNFNAGYRVLTGDFPFIDYYSITGPILDIWQSVIYKIFGVSWSSLVIHSSILNSLYTLIIYFFLRLHNFHIFHIFCYSLSAGILMYPPAGNPTVEHHSLIMSLIAFIFFIIGLKNNNRFYLIISPIFFVIAFFIKQVPTAYFIIFATLVYFFQIYKKIDLISFKVLALSSLFSLFVVSIYFFINKVPITLLFDQYIVIAMDLGESRFNQISLSSIYDNISKLFFLLFLLIPSFIFFIKDNNKSSFIILVGLSFIVCFYEIHSNNQPITFALLPLFLGLLHHDFLINGNRSKFTEYFFYIIISYAFFRILRFEFFYFFIYLFILIFLFYKKFFNHNLQNLNYLFIIYLAITTCFYFEKYIKIRSWDDLKKNDLQSSFKGGQIDVMFKNLNWKTVYFQDTNKEKQTINELLVYLKKLDKNYHYIMITDYQIYNAILNRKDFSPLKYWFAGATYPHLNNPNRKKFEIFFKKKIIDNDIQEIIIDGTANFNDNDLNEFKWLKSCLIQNTDYFFTNDSIKIYNIKKKCIN